MKSGVSKHTIHEYSLSGAVNVWDRVNEGRSFHAWIMNVWDRVREGRASHAWKMNVCERVTEGSSFHAWVMNVWDRVRKGCSFIRLVMYILVMPVCHQGYHKEHVPDHYYLLYMLMTCLIVIRV